MATFLLKGYIIVNSHPIVPNKHQHLPQHKGAIPFSGIRNAVRMPLLAPTLMALLSVAAAQTQLLAAITPLTDTLEVPLSQAQGTVLAAELTAPFALPRAHLSAMDGYALRAADLAPDKLTTLRIGGTAWAGHPHPNPLAPGEAVRIMTGGWLPTGADTVVMQEEATLLANGLVKIPPQPQPGRHVRPAGEEYQAGAPLLTAGTRLHTAALGLLAGFGWQTVPVYRPLRAVLYSTGDEVCQPPALLEPGQIYDSNRASLAALLRPLGIEVMDAGILPDRLDTVVTALRAAAQQADVILTSGGVSVGAADHLTTAIQQLGHLAVWKVAMKPGKPFAFGKLGETLFFGLPGNPVSAVVTFHQFVQAALLKRMGVNPLPQPLQLSAITQDTLRKLPGRAEFQRGWLSMGQQGLEVRSSGSQESHLLSSLLHANCYIVLSAEQEDVPTGSLVPVQPLSGCWGI